MWKRLGLICAAAVWVLCLGAGCSLAEANPSVIPSYQAVLGAESEIEVEDGMLTELAEGVTEEKLAEYLNALVCFQFIPTMLSEPEDGFSMGLAVNLENDRFIELVYNEDEQGLMIFYEDIAETAPILQNRAEEVAAEIKQKTPSIVYPDEVVGTALPQFYIVLSSQDESLGAVSTSENFYFDGQECWVEYYGFDSMEAFNRYVQWMRIFGADVYLDEGFEIEDAQYYVLKFEKSGETVVQLILRREPGDIQVHVAYNPTVSFHLFGSAEILEMVQLQ